MSFSDQYIAQEFGKVRYGRIQWLRATTVGINKDAILVPQPSSAVKAIRTTQMFLQTNGFGDTLTFKDLTSGQVIATFVNIISTITTVNFEFVFSTNKLAIRVEGSTNLNYSIAYQEVLPYA